MDMSVNLVILVLPSFPRIRGIEQNARVHGTVDVEATMASLLASGIGRTATPHDMKLPSPQ
jgi:hypothetical protein